jgi:TPR repeat protein
MSLRFTIAVALSIVCLATPAWADYEAGWDAYNRGDYGTAFRGWLPLAEQGDANAQLLLGILYDKGQRGPHDSVNAHALGMPPNNGLQNDAPQAARA